MKNTANNSFLDQFGTQSKKGNLDSFGRTPFQDYYGKTPGKSSGSSCKNNLFLDKEDDFIRSIDLDPVRLDDVGIMDLSKKSTPTKIDQFKTPAKKPKKGRPLARANPQTAYSISQRSKKIRKRTKYVDVNDIVFVRIGSPFKCTWKMC